MQQIPEFEPEPDLSPFLLTSPRQIVSVLRNLGERKQLVRLLINNGADAVMTSILDIDETRGLLVIDVAPTASMNQRILAADDVEFESSLDSIRIQFSGFHLQQCQYQGLIAFCMPIPKQLLRLQRREFYRVPTPITNPVRCNVRVQNDDGQPVRNVALPLQNVSGGGIALLDDNRQLDDTIGRIYKNCRIDLPGGVAVTVDLQIRNSQEINRGPGKTTRRLGCLFVEPPASELAAIQRYITKLEREQNARNNGLA
jgi:flagellar brake protein